MLSLHRIEAENFLSLRKVSVDLQSLNVLVGPNGAGKTNFLKVIQFLGDTVRLDLGRALDRHGGFDLLRYRGSGATGKSIKLSIAAEVTKYSSPGALDEYSLTLTKPANRVLMRTEAFKFKRTRGRGRRINVSGGKVEIYDEDRDQRRERKLARTSAGLSTLSRLGPEEGAEQVGELGALFETFRIFEVDVSAAREPSTFEAQPKLASDAKNLANFLFFLQLKQPEVFELLQDDLSSMVPGFRRLHLKPVGGSIDAVAVHLEETGLQGLTPLGSASYGTVRALALLAMLHDPAPPRLSCVEEIDHGLHPHALDRVVERLRTASERTQLLVATHSPALVNRLDASELIVCERDEQTGESRIPAIDSEQVRKMEEAAGDLRLGELWFSGVLGGAL